MKNRHPQNFKAPPTKTPLAIYPKKKKKNPLLQNQNQNQNFLLSHRIIYPNLFSLSTPNLYSHYLALPSELRCRTPKLRRYRPLSRRKSPKIVSLSHCFLSLTTESFSPLSTPNVARRFYSFFYCLFSLFFTSYLCASFFLPEITRIYSFFFLVARSL